MKSPKKSSKLDEESKLLVILKEHQLDKMQQSEFKNRVKSDWGENIRTMRLMNNRMVDVEDLRREESEEEDEEEVKNSDDEAGHSEGSNNPIDSLEED